MNKTLVIFPLSFIALLGLSGCELEAKTTESKDVLWTIQQTASQDFSRAASALVGSTTSFCQNKASLSETQQAWLNAMKAWAPLQGANVGNEQATALSWQIQFYPDKKNTTGRQMAKLLQQGGEYSSDSIGKESVAVQGLGAMEWLLFDPSNQGKVETHCALMKAVAQRIESSAQDLSRSWSTNPWQDVEAKQKDTDALRLLAAQLDATMKAIELPMGKPGYPKPYQAQSWRSQQSLTVLRENIVHLQSLYQQTLEPALEAHKQAELAKRLSAHWVTAIDSIPSGTGLKSLLESKEGYRSMITLLNNLEYIKLALHDEAGPALGMIVGFNSTDGD
ncbi:imelysin family protein [Enterovibrio coralii]|uniref:Imelysin-like domain-containing protein n=1 Tax=Enterovibrio coralii TaxID=294935 RepID=A0A135I944_9GAMM|nr:imelysin family protein [Enterovibrio coralii]KXF81975.1 hypothetical protein ATN88_18670 [Enterovibrio coralii]